MKRFSITHEKVVYLKNLGRIFAFFRQKLYGTGSTKDSNIYGYNHSPVHVLQVYRETL